MKDYPIDINCDVGEGLGNEAAIFPYISSCNIACGGHAGDLETMKHVVGLAKEHGLNIGAHPSYPDREHFGRVSMELSRDEFEKSIREQIAVLQAVIDSEGLHMHHIKPHGALYNDLASSSRLSADFLSFIEPYKSNCCLFVPYSSAIAEVARQQGFPILVEAFADRRYTGDYKLASRGVDGAVISRPHEVFSQILMMVKQNEVISLDGKALSLAADTYCVHSDTPSALQILMYLAKELPRHDIYLKK